MGPDDDPLEINRHVIEAFRYGGEIPGMHRDRLLLLTTRGRRTGQERTAPMMFVPPGPDLEGGAGDGRRLVVASGNGSPHDPAWFRNLVADPSVHVEVDGGDGTEAYDATARVLAGDERDREWERLVASYPFFAEHAERAGREIPLVVLEPAPAR
ncbi:nitroreductase/quinone reductase family protein [Luteimicrobium subarcticum]|uniref:Deazaflavin-dependent oxidoreductase (Nitroreductase family) n=1 Tax=Luteimicrobium subarcticum TaxID=620910 RepID=A0A2M8WRY1_9MICO|nr:nitroreductase/quinone reductase family protein [Luteimicrobium subarcticum]PJI93596.1 deazaflavin-dependent oxidoreductase (nitroreductase family) [Luteimicrobium subarcticum]